MIMFLEETELGFDFHYDQSYNPIKTDILVLFRHFLEYFLLFLDDKLDKQCKYFSNCKCSAFA